MPLNNLPSVYIPTVVKLLLSGPSSRTGVIKAEQRGQLQPWDAWHFAEPKVGRGTAGRAGRAWTSVRLLVLVNEAPAWSGSYSWNNSSAFQEWAWACPASVEWAAKPGLAQGFAGLWGNSGWGARWLRSCRLPCTSLECAEPWAAGALGSPCRTGPKASEAHPHRS